MRPDKLRSHRRTGPLDVCGYEHVRAMSRARHRRALTLREPLPAANKSRSQLRAKSHGARSAKDARTGSFPTIEHAYTEKDTMLYALGLGCGSDGQPLR